MTACSTHAYHGWSQEKLAELSGVSQPAISKIEKGGPASAETLAEDQRSTEFSPQFFEMGRLPDLPEERTTCFDFGSTQLRVFVTTTTCTLTSDKLWKFSVRLNGI